jgi:5,10-methenyltetrahydrofolate synthetase
MNQDKRDNKGGSGKAGTGANNAPNASTTPGATTAAWGQTVPAAPAGNGPIDLPELAQRPSARERLLDLRANMAERDKRETVLINRLTRWLKTMPVSRLAFYSPIRGEPDARAAVTAWLAQDKGRTLALPVVNGDLLEFRVWAPGTPLVPGTYGIPVPQGTPLVQPQVVLIPCLGVDMQRYRLGYGGGYYDRTLAAMKVRPVTVGIAFDCGRLRTIGPQPHDIRLDLVITESGVL